MSRTAAMDKSSSGSKNTNLGGLLEQTRAELAEAEAELLEYRQGERPLVERVQVLRRVERELCGGELSSADVSDSEIVGMIRDNASESARLMTPQIAERFGGNGKGYARRLKRMAEKDHMIDGSAAEGYYVAGYDHGKKLRRQTA